MDLTATHEHYFKIPYSPPTATHSPRAVTMAADKPRVLIIGAGMAGLTAAYTLHTAAPDSFRLRVAEASHRLGGRIHSTTIADTQVELGATWIHGITGSPIYDIARKIGALEHLLPYEGMEGIPNYPVTALPGGNLVDPDLASSVSALFSSLLDLARYPAAADSGAASLGDFLNRRRPSATVEAALFTMHANSERIHTAAADLCSIDLEAESEYLEFPGKHLTIPRGYSRVIDHLASALPPGTIDLGRKADRIEWAGPAPPVRVRFADGGSIDADHVIVTVSLGVLKAGAGRFFEPDIPEEKHDAIRRLGFGIVDKLFMEWEPEKEGDGFPYLHMAFAAEQTEEAVAPIPRWMRRTSAIGPVHGGSKLLLAWFAGEEAEEVEELAEEELIAGANAAIAVFGGRGSVGRVWRSEWGKDPLFRGSYSYVAVGSGGDDLDRMAEPLPRGEEGVPRVLFAGEATHRSYYSTTHGAYLSGVREGKRLLHHYGFM